MYQVWIWNDDMQQYVPEFETTLTGKRRIEFEHWNDAANAAWDRQNEDGQLRKVEYRSVRKGTRRTG